MDVDEVNCIEHVLRAAVLLIPVCQLADRHRDAQAREVRLRVLDLARKLRVREDVVVERLGAELHAARDELRLGVRVQGGEELIAPRPPLIPTVEAELRV